MNKQIFKEKFETISSTELFNFQLIFKSIFVVAIFAIATILTVYFIKFHGSLSKKRE